MWLRWFFRNFCPSKAVGYDRYQQKPNTIAVTDIDGNRSTDAKAFAESNCAADPNTYPVTVSNA